LFFPPKILVRGRTTQSFFFLILLLKNIIPSTYSLAFKTSQADDKSINNMPSLLFAESNSIQSLVSDAKKLYIASNFENNKDIGNDEDLICTVAPGRVNLIGEHTDYTGGFVFPMAIDFSIVCVGKGNISTTESIGKCQVISANSKDPQVITFESSKSMKPLPTTSPNSWTNYVAGVVDRYMQEIEDGNCSISLQLAINGNVPLGSGLSSSAALEVSIATFIERIFQKEFPKKNFGGATQKALRCQKAENVFCNSPCGIMDQYVSAAAQRDSALLIDCRNLEYQIVKMGGGKSSNRNNQNDGAKKGTNPVFVICNSNVTHSIGGGEYPVRVAQCSEATKLLQNLIGDEKIKSLRDAALNDIESAKKKRNSQGDVLMDDLIYRRAKHVVTENERTQKAKSALIDGDWVEFGNLMNASHQSMKIDYEVSCEEIDILVELAQSYPGVYGSRLTGGGFGGCTVTLVDKTDVEGLCHYLKTEYKSRTGKECSCFESQPGDGAREILLT